MMILDRTETILSRAGHFWQVVRVLPCFLVPVSVLLVEDRINNIGYDIILAQYTLNIPYNSAILILKRFCGVSAIPRFVTT
jgi:hypothetical protein